MPIALPAIPGAQASRGSRCRSPAPALRPPACLSFIFCWNNFIFALILASADKQPVTVGALAFVTASGIQYGQIAAAIVLSVTPTLLLALYAQRYLVEGLSLGAVKG